MFSHFSTFCVKELTLSDLKCFAIADDSQRLEICVLYIFSTQLIWTYCIRLNFILLLDASAELNSFRDVFITYAGSCVISIFRKVMITAFEVQETWSGTNGAATIKLRESYKKLYVKKGHDQ